MDETTEAVVVGAPALRALFMPVGNTEWVDVPGWEGCRVEIRRLGKYARDGYRAAGMMFAVDADGIRPQGQGEAGMKLRLAQQNLGLALDCVVGWELVLVTQTPEGEKREPVKSPPDEKARKEMLRRFYLGEGNRGGQMWPPEFADWVVYQCKRVNNLLEDDPGNLLGGEAA